MRNEENTENIVQDNRSITSLLQTQEIYSLLIHQQNTKKYYF